MAAGFLNWRSRPGVTIVENAAAPDSITVAVPVNGASRRFTRIKVVTSGGP